MKETSSDGAQWSFDRCVRYEIARSCIGSLIGYRSRWLDLEEHKAVPDLAAITRWRTELEAYTAERRGISIYDGVEKLDRIAREYGAEVRRLFEFSRNAS